MPAISVTTNGDHESVAAEMRLNEMPVLHTTADWSIDALEHGMQSGATSLMLLIPVAIEGVEAVVMAETSLTAWMMASAALAGRFAEEVGKPGWAKLSPAARAVLIPRYAEAIRRAIPVATPEQATEAATMMMDAVGADAPPEAR